MGICVNYMKVLGYIWTFYIILPYVQSTPTLSVSPSSVVVGGSVTFTCTFKQVPLIGADIRSTDDGFVCTLEAAGDGTCTGASGSGCSGNTLSCSADKKTYSLTVNSVPRTWNGKKFICKDTLINNDISQEVLISILVPPGIVKIMPSGNVLKIPEGQAADLMCTTDATRPQSNIRWYRDNAPITGTKQTVTNTTGDKFITSSVLTVSGDRNQQGAQIHCTAINIQGESPVSSRTKTINIHYPPVGTPSFTTANPTLTVGSTVTLTCTLQQDGNPLANWTWSCPGRSIQSNEVTSSNGRSVLQFTSTKSDNGRSCTCRAQSNIGPYDQTSNTAILNVQYSPIGIPTITPTNPTLAMGSTVTLICTIQQDGNPLAIWTWSCPGRTIQTNGVTSINGRSILQFTSTTSDYGRSCTCRAQSNIGPYNQTSASVTLNIQYKPRFDNRENFVEKQLVGVDKKLSISLPIIGNPLPDVTWYRQGNSSNETLNNGSTVSIVTTKEGNVEYKSELNISSIHPEDFGVYFAVLVNSIGRSVVFYSVISQGPPEPPSNIVVDCLQPETANVYWTSNFNGLGENGKQTFYVLYGPKGDQLKRTVNGIPDVGNNMSKSFNVSPGEWVFKVGSVNRIGNVTSEEKNCTVKGAYLKEQKVAIDMTIFGIGASSVLAVVSTIIIFLVIRRKGCWLKNGSKDKTTASETEGTAENSLSMYETLNSTIQNEGVYDGLQTNRSATGIYMNTCIGEA